MNADKRRIRNAYARRKLRAEMKGFAKSEWRTLAMVLAVCVLVLISTRLLGPYARGLFQGCFVMLVVGFLIFGFAVRTQAWNMLCGAWAEDYTREEVSKARQAGHVWDQVSSIEVGKSDIDHVVITPSGILMLESKWSFASLPADRLTSYATQARARGERLRSILRSATVKRLTEVTPMVVVWGKGGENLPSGGVVVDGIRVLYGHDLMVCLSANRTGRVGRDWAEETCDLLRAFADAQIRSPAAASAS